MIDTATLYGTYAHVREALTGWQGEVTIATKTHAAEPALVREHVELALRELRRTDVELGCGTWRFAHLPAADAFFEPGVKLYWLDWSTVFDQPETQAALRAMDDGLAKSIAAMQKARPTIPPEIADLPPRLRVGESGRVRALRRGAEPEPEVEIVRDGRGRKGLLGHGLNARGQALHAVVNLAVDGVARPRVVQLEREQRARRDAAACAPERDARSQCRHGGRLPS